MNPPLLKHDDALFLDFDGTLVAIAERPDLVRPAAGLTRLLEELGRALGGALAIVTGRQLGDVDRLLSPLVFPGAGLHGAQLRLDHNTLAPPPSSPVVLEAAAILRAQFREVPGVLVEDKGLSVALHYRSAPHEKPRCEAALLELAERLNLTPLHGKQVIEARAATVNKGDGILALLAQPPFRGRRPVFAGDDLTDEYGFAAVAKADGLSIKVGPGDSAASHRLRNVTALHTWLRRSLEQMTAGAARPSPATASRSPGSPASTHPG